MKTMYLQNHNLFMTIISAAFAWIVTAIIHPILGVIKPVSPAIISWTQEVSLGLAIVVSLIAIYKFFKHKKDGHR